MKNCLFFLVLAIVFLSGCRGVPLRVSILGDSYSTFQGWIPEGNAVWYPFADRAVNDVTEPDQCWWHLVIGALDGELEENESWSGSTICYTSYNAVDRRDSCFVTRANRLGNPTLILVCGGTNDSWANSPIGDYKWSGWTDEDLATFRPAMAKLLFDLKTMYLQARIFFILNSELKSEINDSVHEACKYYDVPCIDLENIDKQGGHPSIAGMKAFAEQVVAVVKEK